MEDIVAVALEIDSGEVAYFLTWGRIQDPVDPTELAAVVLAATSGFSLGGRALSARVCASLQEASSARYFFEGFFSMSQQRIPYGAEFDKWRRRMDAEMRAGRQLWFLGRPPRTA